MLNERNALSENVLVLCKVSQKQAGRQVYTCRQLQADFVNTPSMPGQASACVDTRGRVAIT